MSLDGIMLYAIKNELENEIIGSRIDKIYIIEDLITITVRQPGNNIKILISANTHRARIHITQLDFENPVEPPAFCMLLRKYLYGAYIINIEQPDFERILTIKIKKKDKIYTLIIEIMGRYSNVILINEEGIILDALKRVNKKISRERELYPGIKYLNPPEQNKINPLIIKKDGFINIIKDSQKKELYRVLMNNIRGIGPDMAKEFVYRANLKENHLFPTLSEKEDLWMSFNSIINLLKQYKLKASIGLNEENKIIYYAPFTLSSINSAKSLSFDSFASLFDYYYEHEVKSQKKDNYSSDLLKVINKFLIKNQKKQNQLKLDLSKGENADELKKTGDLIIANLYKIKKGLKEIELIDYYNPEQNKIRIILNPELSPTDNAQKYYKKYSKAKRSIKYLKHELNKYRHEERYLEQVKLNIEQAENKGEFLEITEELIEEGYIKKKKNIKKKQRKNEGPLPPYIFNSSQGFEILVGKNNKQNDYLTKRMAKKDDIWLHIKDLPGSHVIIKYQNNNKIDDETIKEAAKLAAYYSKGRMSINVPVDYTRIKNVNKPKGAKPGLVFYDNYKTIYVNPDKKLVDKLKIN
jgi:predicted ribosome quality control (RQC) complex YloA/Tae2 family protein